MSLLAGIGIVLAAVAPLAALAWWRERHARREPPPTCAVKGCGNPPDKGRMICAKCRARLRRDWGLS